MYLQAGEVEINEISNPTKTFLNKNITILANQEGDLQIAKGDSNLLISNSHKGPIMDVAFSLSNHPKFFISISYDRTLNLFSLENLSNKPLYKHVIETQENGFFTHVFFAPTRAKQLDFYAATSSGLFYYFSSKNGF